MIRHSTNLTSESWNKLPWRKIQKNVFRLQRRIYKAVREGNLVKAKSLQKLILKSTSAKLLAIRQVTQLNKGKRTAGIDGKKALTYTERMQLLQLLQHGAFDWKHQGLKEIPIPKKNGKVRMLKIPTISDRAWQCLAKLALEPAHEATFNERSYGFRPGRSAKDAQQYIRQNLRSYCNGKDKRVIELDIKKCFDRISHKAIMDRLIAPQALKLGIFRCLKVGISPEFPEQGTPQGGVVSPLLANIALNGIEDVNKGYRRGYAVRYADDMIIFLHPQDDASKFIKNIEEFLTERGMEISPEKTKFTPATNGFDFLGWHFEVHKNGKFRCTPSAENYAAFREKVKCIANSSHYGAETKARKIAPIVRGWRNYHDRCNLNSTRDSLWFLNHATFRKFLAEKKMTKYRAEALVKKAFPSVPWTEGKFVCVKGDLSPFDGDIAYWSKRQCKLYFGEIATALRKQNHICEYCGLNFLPGDDIELHHKDGNHDNWKKSNLVAIHRHCHQYIHSGTAQA